MGMVAGSTVLLLTIIWGSCVVAGKCDLVGSVAQDAQDTKGFNLTVRELRRWCVNFGGGGKENDESAEVRV
uniref:Uncharacterized protein n=1 Tax=Quercus lobata TaxID=97700 RepID=A0A7N2R903_QUELO